MKTILSVCVSVAFFLCTVALAGEAPEAAATAEDGAHAKWDLFASDPGLAAWTVINFVLLLIVLRLFAWKPLKKALASRTENIEGKLDEAESKREEAEKTRAEWEKKMESADEEARKVVREGRENAERDKRQILDKAKEDAEAERTRGVKDAEALKRKAFGEFWNEAAELATALAGKVASKSLSSDDHKALVDEFIKDYEASE